MYVSRTFVENQMTITSWVYFLVFYSTPLLNVWFFYTNTMPLLLLWLFDINGNVIPPILLFLLKILLWLLGVFCASICIFEWITGLYYLKRTFLLILCGFHVMHPDHTRLPSPHTTLCPYNFSPQKSISKLNLSPLNKNPNHITHFCTSLMLGLKV